MAQHRSKAPEPDFFQKAEHFLEERKTMVTVIIAVILIGGAAFFYVKKIYLPKQETAAQEQMYKAQEYFQVDSFQTALNGDGINLGFLDIIEDYGWTKAANLSQYYAGICYLRLGKYENAIKYLKDFDSDDILISSMALGATGDAYSEMGDMDQAISYYKEAANNSDNDITTPLYLFRAGLALKGKGNKEEALEMFNKIKEEYPNSTQARDIDKYIAMVEAS